jgi:phosphoribosyl 1,2-cyclic phosphate phosphodiesterase
MKFQFLGTAAAEGVPALWCDCERCRRSREIGGRALRTRSQALINGELLIDFPADTLKHLYDNRIDLLKVRGCLVTHTHGDHLYPEDIGMLQPGFSHAPDGYVLTFFGSEQVGERIAGPLARAGKFGAFREVKPFGTFSAGRYEITAYPSIHDPGSGPLFYGISDGEKRVLYAHDTHYFHEDVWKNWAETKPRFDLVSLDCTNACLPLTYIGHMGLEQNAEVRSRMLAKGYAHEGTVFVCNHFSHNATNVVYDDFVPIAAAEGFLVSYDGMTLEV